MPDTDAASAPTQLAAFLARRRKPLLAQWRRAVDRDPELTTASTITREQFVDHIPAVLDAFEWRLSARSSGERAQAREEEKDSAEAHGRHRWLQGYNQPETMREWGHLHLCLLQVLDDFESLHSGVDAASMRDARRELVHLCSEGVTASAARHARLQQSEAASRLRELESALAQLQELEHGRAVAWREAAHDLRGHAQTIASASAMLMREGVPEEHRSRVSETFQLGLQSLNKLLTDLMDQARLEAGHEQRHLEHFDVASLLKEYCDSARPMAAEKGLFLLGKGAAPLVVEGDAAKIQRIVQNLVLNALKVTEKGGVRVTWEATAESPQWILCVQDTGPGFNRAAASPIERVLKRATEDAHDIGKHDASDPAPTLASRTPAARRHSGAGEGIGLSIVKRLCELLEASLELETSEGEGTTFRVIFPRQYSGGA